MIYQVKSKSSKHGQEKAESFPVKNGSKTLIYKKKNANMSSGGSPLDPDSASALKQSSLDSPGKMEGAEDGQDDQDATDK